MEQTISIEKRIEEILVIDPIFQVIQETPAYGYLNIASPPKIQIELHPNCYTQVLHPKS